MAKIIDFNTRKILADLPTDMANPGRMSVWEFSDDEHDLQFKVCAIAWDKADADFWLAAANALYRQEIKKVG